MQVKVGDTVTILTKAKILELPDDRAVRVLTDDGFYCVIPRAAINRVLTEGEKIVGVGMVFKDNDWRSSGRHVQVIGITEDGKKALCERVYKDPVSGRWSPAHARAARTTIALASFFKTGGRGFGYVDG